MVCIYYRYIKCWNSNVSAVVTIPIIYMLGIVVAYVYIVCIVDLLSGIWSAIFNCNFYDVSHEWLTIILCV